MRFDEDIKIAGEHPLENFSKSEAPDNSIIDKNSITKSKQIGKLTAERFLSDAEISDDENFKNVELLHQRRILLSFATRVAFENYISNERLRGIAQKSFSDSLKAAQNNAYNSSDDMGAFSFYYLAYRRGDDVERRIGQTFAMLCSHDGDPIFQELGEALYCWFLSTVKIIITENL